MIASPPGICPPGTSLDEVTLGESLRSRLTADRSPRASARVSMATGAWVEAERAYPKTKGETYSASAGNSRSRGMTIGSDARGTIPAESARMPA